MAASSADFATRKKRKLRFKEPGDRKVVLLNDNFTPWDFVMAILVYVFHKGVDEAGRITTNVHNKGRGEVGVYPRDIAETKVVQVQDYADEYGFPLKCVLE